MNVFTWKEKIKFSGRLMFGQGGASRASKGLVVPHAPFLWHVDCSNF
jgi:hypothetical protein